MKIKWVLSTAPVPQPAALFRVSELSNLELGGRGGDDNNNNSYIQGSFNIGSHAERMHREFSHELSLLCSASLLPFAKFTT